MVNGPTPFHTLDNFVKSKLALRHGLNGSVRAWSMDTTACDGDDDLSRSFITYQMKDNRWCENIKRCHKSNNIMWTVSIGDLNYWQSCHDPDCRMASFRGQVKNLPEDVKSSINDVLLEKATEVNESFEQALLDLNLSDLCHNHERNHVVKNDSRDSTKQQSVQHSYEEEIDEEFEQALLNLDLGDEDGNKEKNVEKESPSCDKSDDFDVDEDFERALMALNIDEIDKARREDQTR